MDVANRLEKLQVLAAGRGGRLISDEYVNSKTPLEWECGEGHRWQAVPDTIDNAGSWCPHCITHVGEELVRAALEEAFPGKKFDRTRALPWMGGLELDGYNGELRLAFEYQGIQHERYTPQFHRRGPEDFEAQRKRDDLTRERCIENFVVLIEVFASRTPHDAMRRFVREELRDLGCEGIAPDEGLCPDREFYDRVRATRSIQQTQYARLREKVEEAGGTLISERYLNNMVPVTVRCAEGHEFEVTPMVLLGRKTLCVECHPTFNRRFPKHIAELPSPVPTMPPAPARATAYSGPIAVDADPAQLAAAMAVAVAAGVPGALAVISAGPAAMAAAARPAAGVKQTAKSTRMAIAMSTAMAAVTAAGPAAAPPLAGKSTADAQQSIRDFVATIGHRCLSSEQLSVGWRVTFECPQGHTRSGRWSDLVRLHATGKTICTKCQPIKLGGKPLGTLARWTGQTGIRVANGKAYMGQTVRHVWECQAGHQFHGTYISLRQSKSPCIHCHLAENEKKHGISLLTPWADGAGPSTQLEWRCTRCAGLIRASLLNLCRRKKACDACE
jgi:hypothetical protein